MAKKQQGANDVIRKQKKRVFFSVFDKLRVNYSEIISRFCRNTKSEAK